MGFRLMSLWFRLRDRLNPPIALLREAGVLPGMTVLDFGCGPGGFALAASKLVGPNGLVFALDRNPLAASMVQKAAERQDLHNLRTILADEPSGVPPGTVDFALLYDVLHALSDPGRILKGLRRALKPAGILSAGDHHLRESALLSTVTGKGIFAFLYRSSRTFQFRPIEPNEKTP